MSLGLIVEELAPQAALPAPPPAPQMLEGGLAPHAGGYAGSYTEIHSVGISGEVRIDVHEVVPYGHARRAEKVWEITLSPGDLEIILQAARRGDQGLIMRIGAQ